MLLKCGWRGDSGAKEQSFFNKVVSLFEFGDENHGSCTQPDEKVNLQNI